MSPTLITNKDKSQANLADSFSIIAKNFLLLPGIARDLNEAVQSIVGIVKQKGGEAKESPDEKFIAEKDFQAAEKVKPPTPIKKEEPTKKKGILGDIIENILSPRKMIQNVIKNVKVFFKPKNIMKLLGKIALPALAIYSIGNGIVDAFKTYEETGSIWEAWKASQVGIIGSFLEVVTFGLIGKEEVKAFQDWELEALSNLGNKIKEYFGKFTDWLGEKWDGIKRLFGFDVKPKEVPSPQQEQVAVPEILKGKKVEEKKDAQQQAADLLSKPVTLPGEPPAPTPELQPPAPVPAVLAKPAPKTPTAIAKSPEAAEPIPKPTQKISGMEDVKKMVIRHEGIRTKPYKDSVGLWTVGVGHLIGDGKSLPPEWDREFSQQEVMNLFEQDFAHHVEIAEKGPGYMSANDSAKGGFIDLSFNLGKWWTVMKQAAKRAAGGDYVGTAEELKDSKWFTQVGNRAKEVTSLIASAGNVGQGDKITVASNDVAVGQRQQAKPQTPMVVNAPTTNNTNIVNNQSATQAKDKTTPTNMVLARVA